MRRRMQFLRKHQKKLFILIAVITALSYLSYGGRDIEEKQGGHESDLRAVTELLSLGTSDVLKTDLVETGVISLLAEKYFDEIKPDFSEKLEKAKTATFYSHPGAPFINAMQVWNRFSPVLVRDLKAVQAGSLDPKTFSTYAKLYLDQVAFS